jgi:hypothetical protein
VEKGFLLDGVDLQGAHIVPGNFQTAAFVVPDLANAFFTFGNPAAVGAGVALDLMIGQGNDQGAFSGSLVQLFFKR